MSAETTTIENDSILSCGVKQMEIFREGMTKDEYFAMMAKMTPDERVAQILVEAKHLGHLKPEYQSMTDEELRESLLKRDQHQNSFPPNR